MKRNHCAEIDIVPSSHLTAFKSAISKYAGAMLPLVSSYHWSISQYAAVFPVLLIGNTEYFVLVDVRLFVLMLSDLEYVNQPPLIPTARFSSPVNIANVPIKMLFRKSD